MSKLAKFKFYSVFLPLDKKTIIWKDLNNIIAIVFDFRWIQLNQTALHENVTTQQANKRDEQRLGLKRLR